MKRILEPEIMSGAEQCRAYAAGDFEESHSHIVGSFEQCFPGTELSGPVLDLGCGPGDIAFRFARRFPRTSVLGVDGSVPMIELALERRSQEPEVGDRVEFVCARIPSAKIPSERWTAIISNSLLHHLHDPDVLWNTVKGCAVEATKIFVADLLRPATIGDARRLVETYASGAPSVLQTDFYNSLLAAFEPTEIEHQLARAGLGELHLIRISDRHAVIFGERPR